MIHRYINKFSVSVFNILFWYEDTNGTVNYCTPAK